MPDHRPRNQVGKPDTASSAEAQVHALAQAAWAVLCELGDEGARLDALTQANLRIAYEPFRALVDPDDLASPPQSLAEATRIVREAEAADHAEARPPLRTLHVLDDASGRYDVRAYGIGRIAGGFASVEAAQDEIARRYGLTREAVKASVPTRMGPRPCRP